MENIKLYRYKREDGGITVSPVAPECEYTELMRLIADEGKALTNDGGITRYSCIDVKTSDGWMEVDEPVEDESPSDIEEEKSHED